jgi:hypothetical protein
VATSLGLGNDFSQVSSPRVSLVVDFLFLGGSEGLDGVSSEWRLAHGLGLHHLTPSKGGPEPAPEGAGSVQFAPRSISCTLDYCPLQLWALDVVISATKLGDLYAWTSSLFILVLGSSPFKHIGPCHLWRLLGTWSELLDCLAKRSLN